MHRAAHPEPLLLRVLDGDGRADSREVAVEVAQ